MPADYLPGLDAPAAVDDRADRPTPPRRTPAVGLELMRNDPERARSIISAYLDTGMSLAAIARVFMVSRDVATTIVQGALSAMDPTTRARALFYRQEAIKSKLIETTLDMLDDKGKLDALSIRDAVALVKDVTQPPPSDGPERHATGQLQPAAGDILDIIDAEITSCNPDGSQPKKKSGGASDAVRSGSLDSSSSSRGSCPQSKGFAPNGAISPQIAVSIATDAQRPPRIAAEPPPEKGAGGGPGAACAGLKP